MEILTQRLSLKPTVISDADFIRILVNTPQWIAYIGDRNVRTDKQAKAYVQKAIDAYNPATGVGQFIMRLNDGTPVGCTGIYKRPGLEHADIGFALLPDHFRKGYALEGTKAIMDHVIASTEIKRIEGITVEENTSSRKLLEKLGLSFEKIVHLPGDPTPLLLYAIDL